VSLILCEILTLLTAGLWARQSSVSPVVAPVRDSGSNDLFRAERTTTQSLAVGS